MLISILRLALLGAVCCTYTFADAAEGSVKFQPKLDSFVAARTAEFDQIPAQRKALLKQLAQYIRENSAGGRPVRLTFICTHNSRRSHLAQIWASVAAQHYGINKIETYSGGTESTAFNPRAVAAVQRAGLEVSKQTEGANPRYRLRTSPQDEGLVCFSKRFDSPPNPAGDFCAILTCSQADESCPLVPGAKLRLAVPYDDPKIADGTPKEQEKYDERCAQIAREMLYVFSEVGK